MNISSSSPIICVPIFNTRLLFLSIVQVLFLTTFSSEFINNWEIFEGYISLLPSAIVQKLKILTCNDFTLFASDVTTLEILCISRPPLIIRHILRGQGEGEGVN